uniref:Putative secreted protein n=1 Tax=Ixodes ricinus TaxID=34613 RepID=A0A6B0UFK2_IXORI
MSHRTTVPFVHKYLFKNLVCMFNILILHWGMAEFHSHLAGLKKRQNRFVCNETKKQKTTWSKCCGTIQTNTHTCQGWNVFCTDPII